MKRALAAGVFLLPLVCWPALERPFSTPKIAWLLCLDLVVLAMGVRGRWPWPVWVGAVGLSAAFAPFVSLEAALLALAPLPLWWAGRSVERLREAVVWGSVAESALVALQWVRLDPFAWIGWRPEAFSSARMRVYGTLGNPDFVAAWLCATLPLHFRARMPWWRWAAAALQAGAILATGSRVAVLAVAAAAVMLAVRGVRLGKWWLLAPPLAAAALWLSPARALDVTLQGRLYLARVTASHWTQIPPLTGFGPGSFRLKFPGWQADWLRQHPDRETFARFVGQTEHAHNDYLEFGVEYGLLGLGAFLGLSAWLMAKAWRNGPPGAWAGLACLLAAACVDFPFHRPAEWGLYWLMLGFAGSAESPPREQ
jgi:putative inorganic carbon (HCO3(-)) transporter